jgi:hypothetical protein
VHAASSNDLMVRRGRSPARPAETLDYGVVKMNVDTYTSTTSRGRSMATRRARRSCNREG